MNGKYLLDTNIIIGLFSKELSIIQRIQSSDMIYIPVIVIGELYYGAYNSKDIENNIHNIQEFINNVFVLNCDSLTSDYYGQIKMELKKSGKPIPENDIWIAALAQQHDLILATRDSHFQNVRSISIEHW